MGNYVRNKIRSSKRKPRKGRRNTGLDLSPAAFWAEQGWLKNAHPDVQMEFYDWQDEHYAKWVDAKKRAHAKKKAAARRKKVPARRNTSFGTRAQQAKDVILALEAYESQLYHMLDNLDRWHKPGSGNSLDKAYRQIHKAQKAVVAALDDLDPEAKHPAGYGS